MQSQFDTSVSPEDLAATCAALNSVRANFTVCCQYAMMVMWRWQMNQCVDNCARRNLVDNSNCCQTLCNYRAINIIAPANNNANNITYDPTAGLIAVFMLSVGNNTQWTSPITDSITYCFNAVLKQPDYDSCGIPTQLYDIINCAYIEIFYRCPLWNPSNLPECDYTRQYVDQCYRVKVEA